MDGADEGDPGRDFDEWLYDMHQRPQVQEQIRSALKLKFEAETR